MLSTVVPYQIAVLEIPTGLINCSMIATGNHLIFIRCAEHHPRNDMILLPDCIVFTAKLNDNLPNQCNVVTYTFLIFGYTVENH